MPINSPNMNLPIPVVGVDAGPAYATSIDSCLTIVDSHNHSPGSGVQITPDGLNISSTLSIQNQFITNIGGLTFSSQVSTPANQTVYFSGVNLFVTDGNGNVIPITASGGLAGTPGSIANLTAPASASYVAANSTFVFQSDTSTAANIDGGSFIFRNITSGSHGITVSPPVGLGSDYTITLPALPPQTNFLTITSSGAMASNVSVDNSTLTILGGTTLKVADGGIGQVQLGNDSVSTNQLQNGSVTTAKIATANVTSDSLNALPANISGFGNYSSASNPGVIATVVVTTTPGRFVKIEAVPGLASFIQVSGATAGHGVAVYKDGTQLFSVAIDSGFKYPMSAFSFIDNTLTGGTHTYQLVAQPLAGQTLTASSVAILAYELR